MKKISIGDAGDEVAAVHKLLKTHGVSVPETEVKRKLFGPGTREAVAEFQRNKGLAETKEVSSETAKHLLDQPAVAAGTILAADVAALRNILDPGPVVTVDPNVVGPVNPDPTTPALPGNGADHLVTGRVLLDHGMPANGLTLRFYNKDFGTDTRISETKTDATGAYSLPFSAGGKAVNLEIRAVDSSGKEVSLSDTKFNASKQETINLIAPRNVQALRAEFTQLRTDVEKQIDSLDKLSSAQETGERQDLTLLHNSTGWDARLIGLAATANKLSFDTGIPQEALYAAFRAGLPTDKQQLAQVSNETFEQVLTKTNEAGIVSLTKEQVAAARTSFANFQITTQLATKAPGAVSTFGELLNVAGSTAALKLNDKEKQLFADVYFSNRSSTGELWQKARERGVPDAKINALRLEGKLAYLTLNNANLVATLQNEIGSAEKLTQLVDKDLYKQDAWKARLGANEVPAGFDGGVDAYAAELARKVRVSFPTQVVGRMVQNDELNLGENHEVLKAPVQTFLKNAVDNGFELGRQPLGTFIKENSEAAFKGIADTDVQATTEALETVQRLYQITPSNEALSTAMSLGFRSAHDVTAFPQEVFLDRFGLHFRTLGEAKLFYKKSEQITTVVYNFVTAAKQLEAAAPIFVTSAPAEDRENAKNNLIKHFPTMESLFGSMDFCECEHCRSVLSPAAYLVDLLQFLDPKPLVWNSTMTDWKTKHNGAPYPFLNPKAFNDFLTEWRSAHPGQPDPDTQKTPYDILIERRPDLPHLSLTCENTTTALPYIDIVNEILEYYVANEKLDQETVRNTGNATTPELLAEPQNVTLTAYDKLKAARYPLNLPFDLWLETVRQFFEQSDSSLWNVLELLRPADELMAPAVNPKPYYRDSIFMEYLGISPAEREIFTAGNPLARWFELYGYQNEADALSSLKSAKTLSRRLGVTYKELVELIQTWFVNPRLDALVILRKLEVELSDLLRYEAQPGYPPFTPEEKQAFEKRITDVAKTVNLTFAELKTKLDNAFQAANVNELLLLNDPSTVSSFDLTALRFGDGKDPDALVYLKINLFVRLWKKLGWTIEETDRAIKVFTPKNSLPLTAAILGEALGTVLIYIAHLKVLRERVNVGKDSIAKLLTLWSNLSTKGRNPLYGQLFLKKSILKNDAVFDDPLGEYLTKPGLLIKDHILAIQSALNLTVDDIKQILEDRTQALETAPLSVENLSLLFRYGLTARALKISVSDLISIRALSGLDPFTPLSNAPLTKLEDDHPFNQTLKFFEIAEKIKQSGFKVEDLDYLFRHRFDPVGKYRLNTPSFLDLVRTLANGIQRITSEHSLNGDAAAFTDDVLRQKLALALPAETAETFMAMWTGTKEYEAVANGVTEANQLKPENFAIAPSIRVSYDKTRQQQHLTVRGVLTDGRTGELKTAFPFPNVGGLLDEVNKQAHDFFDKNLLKSAAGDPFVGFLDAGDFETFFAPEPAGSTDIDRQNRIRAKRAKLANAFLPFLQQRLIRQLVLQTASNNLVADPSLVEVLILRGDMLADSNFPGRPLLTSFLAAGQSGVSVSYFADGGAVIQPASSVATVDTQGKPATTKRARFHGYLEVPATGAYRFFINLGKKDATAELRFEHLADPLVRGTAAADNAEISQFTELKAGLLYEFTVEFDSLGAGDAAMFVSSQDLPKGSLARLKLYPSDTVDRISRAWTLLSKTLLIGQGFAFSEGELGHLLTHGEDFGNLDLSKLPTSDQPQPAATTAALFAAFVRLADLATLKREVADSTNDLLAIFQNARRSHPSTFDATQARNALLDDVCNRFATLTRRDTASVREAVNSLGLAVEQTVTAAELRVSATGFTDERGISRLWELLKISERLGVSTSALVRWATPAPNFAIARELKDTVKARYEVENWQRIARPVFDKLRQKQRDALVAHTIHRHGFDRLEQLFEYFLIDPGMEPVVQTSRLRLAISSLQLFIQRCLLNLEPQISPSVINADHWQWMKRYRVWEANRKIFLFPENWLEPEFRDDKTYLFQELESALLEGDVSNDSVEDAFYEYLKKLEEIAKLDIVAMYCDRKPEPDANVFYVVGRTHSLPHKYFYRRYAHQMWTPWEPISVEIEGDHIVAIIWRERLHLFWLTFMEKAKKNSGTGGRIPATGSIGDVAKVIADAAPLKEVEVQLNWSELFQGEWTARRSSGFVSFTPPWEFTSFNSADVFVSGHKEYDNGEERAVRINLGGAIQTAFRIVSKHSQPEQANSIYWLGFPYSGTARNSQFVTSGSKPLEVTFFEQIKTEDGKLAEPKETKQKILTPGNGYSLLACNELFGIDLDAIQRIFPNQDVVDRDGKLTDLGKWLLNEYLPTTLTSPFFYQDAQNTFFVEPTLTETTIDRWEEWVIPSPGVRQHWEKGVVDKIPVEPRFPIDPRIRVEIDPRARFSIDPKIDWTTHPATLLSFDDRLIGQNGSVDISSRELGGVAEVAVATSVLATPAATGLPAATGVATSRSETLVSANALNIVSGSGLNATTLDAITSTPVMSDVFGSISKINKF